MKRGHKGFTIVELVIVMVVIGILATIIMVSVSRARERSYLTRANADLLTVANATKLYVNKHNEYPPDVSRNIPAEIKEFISSNIPTSQWPSAPWPGSNFDYDAWDVDGDGTDETIQISIRFCPLGGDLSTCTFPKEPWVTGFNTNSAYYYCLKGYCRAHEAAPYTNPGYCVNCPNNAAIKKPGE